MKHEFLGSSDKIVVLQIFLDKNILYEELKGSSDKGNSDVKCTLAIKMTFLLSEF